MTEALRILLVVPPLVGHVSPVLGVAHELTTRGHEVAWAGEPRFLAAFVDPDTTVYPCGVPWSLDSPPERPADVRGPSALKFLWEEVFIPLSEAMAPGVEAAIDAFAPDLVFADQQALAGAFVAERMGVPWVTSATTSAELTDPLAGLPKVAEWLADLFADLREQIGDPSATADPRFSPALTVAFSAHELIGSERRFGTPVAFVGPVFRPLTGAAARTGAVPVVGVAGSERGDLSADLDDAGRIVRWAASFDDPVALVALGTANAAVGAPFLRSAAEGLAAAGVVAVIADPSGALSYDPDGDADDAGAAGVTGSVAAAVAAAVAEGRMLVAPHLPQQHLLPHIAVFVSHAGHNSVCESLWNDVPMVLAPIRDDQPVIAAQVVDAGAGLRLRFGRVSPDRIAESVLAVSRDPAFSASAARLGSLLRSSGGAAAAADALENVLVRVRPLRRPLRSGASVG